MILRGVWTKYHAGNCPLPAGMHVHQLAVGADGRVWVDIFKEEAHTIDGVRRSGAITYGLMVFEENTWKSFSLKEVGFPIPDVFAYKSGCDLEGNLWLYLVPRSPRRILCRFNGQTVKIHHSGENGLPADMGTFSAFAGDKEGNVWAAMGLMGLYFFDGSIWRSFSPENVIATGDMVTCVISDSAGVLWFAIQQANTTKFVTYDGSRCEEFAVAPVGYRSANVQALAVDSKGLLWVGWGDPIMSSQVGLWTFDSTSKEPSAKYTTKNSSLPNNQMNAIVFDKKGRAWVATSDGLTIFDGTSSVCLATITPGKFSISIHNNKEPCRGYPNKNGENYVGTDVVIDTKGRVWSWSNFGIAVFSEQM